ncbi:MAG TPA: cysteine--tRNA ligase, partial [Bacteroidales bacterium]|nr:cysteine--tRNA ligase [Bacteroidales bacterium]
RVLDDLLANTRALEGQDEKRNPFDFALWKKAQPEHIMRWPSPWSEGFPGWHLECSAMSNRYLGDLFDIHGGGMDLLFPHHEAEIAQSCTVHGKDPVKYWMHNNMITIEGQKMGKSLGNFITLNEFFNGAHVRLEKAFSPMTIRFFILQAHYRSTLDFSNEALMAAEKGLERLMAGRKVLEQLKPGSESTFDVAGLQAKCYAAMDDDFNSPIAIAHLFDAVRIINSIKDGKGSLTATDLHGLREWVESFVVDILGLKEEVGGSESSLMSDVVGLLIRLRAEAKARKDFQTADEIRDELGKVGIVLKDTRDGVEWQISGKDI